MSGHWPTYAGGDGLTVVRLWYRPGVGIRLVGRSRTRGRGCVLIHARLLSGGGITESGEW